jgi:hypothetical protein
MPLIRIMALTLFAVAALAASATTGASPLAGLPDFARTCICRTGGWPYLLPHTGQCRGSSVGGFLDIAATP